MITKLVHFNDVMIGKLLPEYNQMIRCPCGRHDIIVTMPEGITELITGPVICSNYYPNTFVLHATRKELKVIEL